VLIAGILLAWLLGFTLLRGQDTLNLATADVNALHTGFNHLNDAVGANRDSNPLFLYFFNEIRLVIDQLTTFISGLVSQPAYGRPLPLIGWLGVVVLFGYGSWALGNFKVALLAVAGFTFMGLQGLWQESMDTLALTLTAVLVALLIGIPLGIWAGLSDRVNRIVIPVLERCPSGPGVGRSPGSTNSRFWRPTRLRPMVGRVRGCAGRACTPATSTTGGGPVTPARWPG